MARRNSVSGWLWLAGAVAAGGAIGVLYAYSQTSPTPSDDLTSNPNASGALTNAPLAGVPTKTLAATKVPMTATQREDVLEELKQRFPALRGKRS